MEQTVVISFCRSSEKISIGTGAIIAAVSSGNAGSKRGFLLPAVLCDFLLHETILYSAGILSTTINGFRAIMNLIKNKS